LPTVLYFLFFPTALFLSSILAHRIPKAFVSTFGFAPTAHANPKAKSKGPFFFNTLFGRSKLLIIFVNLFR
jgi:hypothetical protein